MRRIPSATVLMIVAGLVRTADAGRFRDLASARGPMPKRDIGHTERAPVASGPARVVEGPLARATLLREIANGTRPLLAFDPSAKSVEDPKSKFLVVRDRMAYDARREHLLGIFTPASGQPTHIREVRREDAAHLGRMIWTLLYSDTLPGAKASDSSWGAYVNMFPAVPRLHIHAQSGVGIVSTDDWHAFALNSGYEKVGGFSGFSLWRTSSPTGAQGGITALAIPEPPTGRLMPRELASDANRAAIDALIGHMWLATARLSTGASQIEMRRDESQPVVRAVGGFTP